MAYSLTPCAISASSFVTSRRSARRAHVLSSMHRLPDAPTRSPAVGAAFLSVGNGTRAHQKGELSFVHDVFSFASRRPVTQPVTPLIFLKEAALEDHPLQRELPLLARMGAPDVVPVEIVRTANTYRQAVRLCWQLRRLRRLTFRQLAAETGVPPQHVGDYFNADDGRFRRDLPGDSVKAIEAVLGNTAITQWHAQQAQLTVLEEMQATRRAA